MVTKNSYEQLEIRNKLLEKQLLEAKKCEKELRLSEKRLKDVIDNVSAWIWEVDAEGKYTYASDMVVKLLEYEPQEVIGKHFYDFFPPDTKEELKKAAFNVFDQKSVFRNFTNHNIRKNGKSVWFHTSGVPIFDKNGELIGYRGADTDVTEQYLAQKALKESEEHLRSLMQSADNFVVYRLAGNKSSPHDLKVVFVSPSIREVLGIEPSAKFDSWFENIHPEDTERIFLANKRAFNTFKFDEEYRTWHKMKGEWRWIHAISHGTNIENLWTGYVNGIMIDVTEKYLTFEKLKTRENELHKKSEDLKEMNTALNVLIERIRAEKLKFQESITANIQHLITPYIDKLKNSNLDSDKAKLIEVIASNLSEITENFSRRLSSKFLNLTSSEIEVANLVKLGKTTKEIAETICVSIKTVESHREKIRKKLGISNQKINLKSYLLSMPK